MAMTTVWVFILHSPLTSRPIPVPGITMCIVPYRPLRSGDMAGSLNLGAIVMVVVIPLMGTLQLTSMQCRVASMFRRWWSRTASCLLLGLRCGEWTSIVLERTTGLVKTCRLVPCSAALADIMLVTRLVMFSRIEDLMVLLRRTALVLTLRVIRQLRMSPLKDAFICPFRTLRSARKLELPGVVKWNADVLKLSLTRLSVLALEPSNRLRFATLMLTALWLIHMVTLSGCRQNSLTLPLGLLIMSRCGPECR